MAELADFRNHNVGDIVTLEGLTDSKEYILTPSGWELNKREEPISARDAFIDDFNNAYRELSPEEFRGRFTPRTQVSNPESFNREYQSEYTTLSEERLIPFEYGYVVANGIPTYNTGSRFLLPPPQNHPMGTKIRVNTIYYIRESVGWCLHTENNNTILAPLYTRTISIGDVSISHRSQYKEFHELDGCPLGTVIEYIGIEYVKMNGGWVDYSTLNVDDGSHNPDYGENESIGVQASRWIMNHQDDLVNNRIRQQRAEQSSAMNIESINTLLSTDIRSSGPLPDHIQVGSLFSGSIPLVNVPGVEEFPIGSITVVDGMEYIKRESGWEFTFETDKEETALRAREFTDEQEITESPSINHNIEELYMPGLDESVNGTTINLDGVYYIRREEKWNVCSPDEALEFLHKEKHPNSSWVDKDGCVIEKLYNIHLEKYRYFKDGIVCNLEIECEAMLSDPDLLIVTNGTVTSQIKEPLFDNWTEVQASCRVDSIDVILDDLFDSYVIDEGSARKQKNIDTCIVIYNEILKWAEDDNTIVFNDTFTEANRNGVRYSQEELNRAIERTNFDTDGDGLIYAHALAPEQENRYVPRQTIETNNLDVNENIPQSNFVPETNEGTMFAVDSEYDDIRVRLLEQITNSVREAAEPFIGSLNNSETIELLSKQLFDKAVEIRDEFSNIE